MTRLIRTVLISAAVSLGILLPAGAALASAPATDPSGGVLTWQFPSTD